MTKGKIRAEHLASPELYEMRGGDANRMPKEHKSSTLWTHKPFHKFSSISLTMLPVRRIYRYS
jgi:hypothetical protein